MEIIAPLQKLRGSLEKYRWPMIVLLLGIGLMLLPTGGSPEQETLPETAAVLPAPEDSLQKQLEAILSQIQGAGQVRVLLTERTGSETRYQSDSDSDTRQDGSALREETVILERNDRTQTGLVQRVDPPQYLGAVVVCQGGDDPRVKLAITEAVSCATGLGTDRISVMKMK